MMRHLALAAGSALLLLTQALPAAELGMKEKLSYTVGFELGQGLQADEADIDVDMVLRGVQDAMTDGARLLDDAQMKEVRAEYQKQRRAARERMAQANRERGQKFLIDNKKKSEVTELPSGLQYQVLKSGNGKSPTLQDRVKVHYRGALLDGTEFDSSYERGNPTTLPLSRVVPGWREALQLMKVGGHWKLWVPSGLAYGERGAGNRIGPNETLTFEIELLGIE